MPSEHQFSVIDDTLIDISCGCFFWFFAKGVLFLEALKLIFLLVCVFFFHLELKCQILLGVFVKKMNFYFIPKYPKFDIMVVFWWFFLVSFGGRMPSWILLLKVHKKSPFYRFLIAIGL